MPLGHRKHASVWETSYVGSVEPMAIDASFVGRHADGVAGAQFGSETVLVDASRARSHVLNTSASLVWMLLDGSASLGDICADVATELSVPYATVLADAIAIVEQMAEMGVVVDHATPVVATSLVPEPTTTSSWFDDNFSLGDAGLVHVHAGDQVIAVRSNTEAMAERLRALFAPGLADVDATDPSLTLSILSTPTRGRVAGSHFLYRGEQLASRSASVGRLVRAVRTHLDDLAEPDDDVVRLHARVLARADRVVLAVNRPGDLPDVGGRAVSKKGWAVVDGPQPRLDPATLEIVVPPHQVGIDETAWAAFELEHPLDAGVLVLAPGRASVQRIVVLDAEGRKAPGALPPAQRAVALLPFVPALDADQTVNVLRVLAELAEETQVVQSSGWQDRNLAGVLPA